MRRASTTAAAAVVLMKASEAAKENRKVLGPASCPWGPRRARRSRHHGQRWPIPASSRGPSRKAGWSIGDLDLIEGERGRSPPRPAPSTRTFGWDTGKVNVNGGRDSHSGHPIGASGARVPGHAAL